MCFSDLKVALDESGSGFWDLISRKKGEKMRRVNARRVNGSGGSLTDLVFSWSLADVLNENLYKKKVRISFSFQLLFVI